MRPAPDVAEGPPDAGAGTEDRDVARNRVDAGADAGAPARPRTTVTTVEVLPEEAVIRVNGEDRGRGRTVVRLDPGDRAAIRLELPGHRAEAFNLTHPGPRKIFKRLAPLPQGLLRVRWLPATASLLLDGARIPVAEGLNIAEIPAAEGSHVLRLEGPDGRSAERPVEVRAGETIGITLQIE
jgi:hypothetical protein